MRTVRGERAREREKVRERWERWEPMHRFGTLVLRISWTAPGVWKRCSKSLTEWGGEACSKNKCQCKMKWVKRRLQDRI